MDFILFQTGHDELESELRVSFLKTKKKLTLTKRLTLTKKLTLT